MIRTIWQTNSAGSIKNLVLRTDIMKSLKADQIRIETKAVGLNFADIFALVGLYSATPKGTFTPGLEFSGIVEEVGQQVTTFQVGDAVIGLTRFGGYSTVIDVKAEFCSLLPEGWSFAEGAAFPVQTLTAYYALKSLGDVKADQNVLIHSAAGGVGLQAMKICQKIGANPIGTVGNEQKKEFLAQSGFDKVIVRTKNFPQEVRKILAENELHLVLDAIGGKIQKQSYDLLAAMGRLIVFGAAEFTPAKNRPKYIKSIIKYLRRPHYDVMKMINANKSVMAFNLIWLTDKVDLFHSLLDEIKQLKLDPPHVGRTFPFEEAHPAIEHLRSGKSLGKVLLHIETPQNT